MSSKMRLAERTAEEEAGAMEKYGSVDGSESAVESTAPDGMRGGAEHGVPEAVSVEIYDQVYNLRGTDAEYIEQLAELVDGKMRAVAAHGSTVDSLRVAVLAALNIADELLALRERHAALAGSIHKTQDSVRSRAGTLAGMLDEVLEDRRAG